MTLTMIMTSPMKKWLGHVKIKPSERTLNFWQPKKLSNSTQTWKGLSPNIKPTQHLKTYNP